jgi:hypothetical protein
MFGVHTKPDEPGSKRPGKGLKREPSNADTLPGRHGSVKNQAPRRQISNPVQRSASHAQDQYRKANPANTSRPDPKRNVPGNSPTTPRPGVQRAGTSYHTRYIEMLLNLDTIPRLHNIYASFFSWIVLAGFVVVPGTFTSIQDLTDDPSVVANGTASTILDHVKNVPLLVIAAICCGVGVGGMMWLAYRWRQNYVWLLNRLFLPGVMNGLAGLISSLITVYTQQHGDWSVVSLFSESSSSLSPVLYEHRLYVLVCL